MSDKPIRALIEILENVPNRWYGKKARLAQHSVLTAMAKYANADGKNIWASLATIAYAARVSTRTAQRAIDFFLLNNRLHERPEPSQYGTKIYDLILPTAEDAKEAKRERAEIVEKERAGARERVARFRDKKFGNGQIGVTQEGKVTDAGALRNGQSRVTVTDSGALCNAQLAVDLSLDRPSYRPEREEAAAAAAPKDTASLPADATAANAALKTGEAPKTAASPLPVSKAANAAGNPAEEHPVDEQKQLLKSYTRWRENKWPKLSFTKKERDAINADVLNCECDLSALQQATGHILDGLDVSDGWNHAGNKLAAGLADKADAIMARRAEKVERIERRREYQVAMNAARAAGDQALYTKLAEECRRVTREPGEMPELIPPF